MKKLARILLLAVAAMLLVSAFAACTAPDNRPTLKFGTNAEFAPFEFVPGGKGVIGEFDGIDIAIAKKIGDENGYKAEIVNMEFDSLLLALENGQCDAVIAAMTIGPERAEEVDFSIPYFNATQVMIVREDSTIAKAEDMKGQRIAVIQGYTGQMAVDKLGEGYSYEAFKKGPDAMLELKNNKCDVVVIDSITAYKYVAETDGLKIVVDNNAFEGEQYGVAVKKGNTELLNMINASLQKMLDDGTIDRLAAQYAEEE